MIIPGAGLPDPSTRLRLQVWRPLCPAARYLLPTAIPSEKKWFTLPDDMCSVSGRICHGMAHLDNPSTGKSETVLPDVLCQHNAAWPHVEPVLLLHHLHCSRTGTHSETPSARNPQRQVYKTQGQARSPQSTRSSSGADFQHGGNGAARQSASAHRPAPASSLSSSRSPPSPQPHGKTQLTPDTQPSPHPSENVPIP
jgi:hypothetical protein